jgi:pantothenate kinase
MTPSLLLDEEAAVERASRLARENAPRTILGLAGAPGSGKSTWAARLVDRLSALGHRVALVPMDGFHLAHAVLTASGDVAVKGAPRTFDAAGYVALLTRLRAAGDEVVWAPRFDRDLEDAIAGSIAVGPEVDVVVTEGNYLLLAEHPWSRVRELLDECWYVDVPDTLRRERLAARHRSHGRSDAEAWERTDGSDEVNARLVVASRGRADAVVTPG